MHTHTYSIYSIYRNVLCKRPEAAFGACPEYGQSVGPVPDCTCPNRRTSHQFLAGSYQILSIQTYSNLFDSCAESSGLLHDNCTSKRPAVYSGIPAKYTSDFDQLIVIVLAMEKGLFSKDLRRSARCAGCMLKQDEEKWLYCGDNLGCWPCQQACSPNSICPRSSRTAASLPAMV